MGMLLRRRFDNTEPVKTTENKEPKKAEAKAITETVKDEKPKTVRRGRPAKY